MAQVNITEAAWSSGQKLTFRFFFIFFLLYIFFNPNGVLPFSETLFESYIQPFHRLIPWIGRHILHLSYEITVFTNGSGDTTYDYVVFLCIFIIAIAGSLAWTALDRHRSSYQKLYYWLRVVVRYYLAITMLSYGSAKVFKLQFPFPDLDRLLEPYGNSSPMGLSWTFMGYSKGYNYYIGLSEVVGGLLLFFRRTTPAGAFLTLIVATNVMVFNYCFDIPVKLLSTTLVIMCLFLLAENLRRLWDLFFRNKATTLHFPAVPPIRKKWLRYSLRTIKLLLIGFTLVTVTIGSVQMAGKYGDSAPRVPLYGIYNVESFVKNRDTLAPLQTDTLRWKQLYIDGRSDYSSANIKMMDDSYRGYTIRTDTIKRTVTLFDYSDTARKFLLSYQWPASDVIVMTGGWKGDSVRIRMKKYDLNQFRLVNRGFHWINEYPFNR